MIFFSVIFVTVAFDTELYYLTPIHSFIGCSFHCLNLYPLHVFGVSLTRFKEFKIFLPCSFMSLSETFTVAFWRVWGVIDFFNKVSRKIASEVEKTED